MMRNKQATSAPVQKTAPSSIGLAREVLQGSLGLLFRGIAASAGMQMQVWSANGEPLLGTGEGGLLPALKEVGQRALEASHAICTQSGDTSLLAVPAITRFGVPAVVTASLPPLARAESRQQRRDEKTPKPASGIVAGGPGRERLDSPAPNEGSARLLLEDAARTLAEQIEATMERVLMAEDLSQTRAGLSLLSRLSSHLARPADLRETGALLLEGGLSACGAEAGMLRFKGWPSPVVAASPSLSGRPAWLAAKHARTLASRLADLARSMREGGTEVLSNTGAWGELLPSGTSVALSPINVDEGCVGFIAFFRTSPGKFRWHQTKVVESVAQQAALAYINSNLYEDLNEFLMSTVKALVSAIEAKDSYTSGHSARVNLISMLIGREMGLAGSELEALRWGSILHDIGKIGMPESILKKPGKLSPEEYEIVKQHPRRGFEVLSHIHQLQEANQGVLLHHERYDGKGYPLGLPGPSIPRIARIIAVADTYDALTSDRPYRPACTIDQAYETIRRESGRQLDPETVEYLGRMIPFLKEHRVMLEDTGKAA